MNPQTILKKVQETYSTFHTYADEGTVDRLPPIGQTSLEFRTYFSQPARFRFEWCSWFPDQTKDQPGIESSIWTDGKTTHQNLFGQVSHPELVEALASATGVSQMSVLMISKLLLPKSIDYAGIWYQMNDVMMLADEEINGFSCYHLMGTTLKINDKEAWVGKDDFIVRRLKVKTDVNSNEIKNRMARMIEKANEMGFDTSLLPSMPLIDMKFDSEFNYQKVVVDQPMPDDLFDREPAYPPNVPEEGK